MWSLILVIAGMLYIGVIVALSYHLGQSKTDNPKQAALIGFLLSFLPPLALIYLVVLFLKEDVAIV